MISLRERKITISTVLVCLLLVSSTVLAGSITGRVTRQSDGEPIVGLWVYTYDLGSGGTRGSDQTDGNGEYEIASLASGNYRVNVSTRNTDYVPEYYDNQLNWNDADPVTVIQGQVTSGIDFELAAGGSITGRVISQSTGEPIADLQIWAYDFDSGNHRGQGTTDGNGEYEIIGLVSGNYRVRVDPWNTVYVQECYDNQLSQNDADPVAVIQGQETVGIDFELAVMMEVQKCKVKAGKTWGKDGITFSGLCYATIGDLEKATSIDIWVMSDTDGYEAYDEQLHIDHTKIKKGKYSHKDKAKGISFKLDTVKHKFTLQIKNANLTGLGSPLSLEIEIGSYYGAGSADETVVNGKKKPIPIQLMSGYMDTLRVDKIKVKKGKKALTDSLSVKGAFTLKDDDAGDITSMTLSLGGQSLDIPGSAFSYKKTTASCKNYDTGSGFVSAKFDTAKCKFIVTIKKADLATTSGTTGLGIAISMTTGSFNQSVEIDLD